MRVTWISQFSWLAGRLLETTSGKQTPAAPELQLSVAVWSDKSFFWLHHQDLAGSALSRKCFFFILAVLDARRALPRLTVEPSFERRVLFWHIWGTCFGLWGLSSQGFGCRAALQRSTRLTMTRHSCACRLRRRRPREG